MFKKGFKLSKKGFTLIEMVVVIGIIVLFCGFCIATITTIPQTRMKKFVTEIKSDFELARDFSKSHGGTISLYISKLDDGLELKRDVRDSNKRSDYNIKSETVKLTDRKVELYYKETNQTDEKRLGDASAKDQIEIQFSQTDGRIIGPDFIDYIKITNGNKLYKLIIMQSTGQVYFDYELKDSEIEENKGAIPADEQVRVDLPCFIEGQVKTTDCFYMPKDDNLSTLQPPIKYDSRYIKISGVYRATEANDSGPYIIYFDLKDPNGTRWDTTNAEEARTTKILKWNIVN